ncbi:MAG: hypothetical protein AB7V62_16860 [Thermoleophilia bacterium]
MDTRPPLARRVAAAALCAGAALLLAACAGEPAAVGPGAGDDAAPPAAPAWPWAHQPDGAPLIGDVRPQRSLEFPPGTGYDEALTSLFIAARQGALPAEARLRDPLPAEVVYAEEADGRGLRLSLTAPWGWVPSTGAIRAPSVSISGRLSPDEALAVARAMHEPGARPLPAGVAVDVPRLPPCQVVTAGGKRPPCA